MSAGNFPWWYPRKSHEAWTRVREGGVWRFVLVNGLLLYGGLMFVFTSLVSPYIRQSADMLSPERLAINAAIWSVAGLGWGALTWYFGEKNFLKYATDSRTPEP